MQYPMAATTLHYRKQKDGRICVEEGLTKVVFVMREELARFLRRLDGRTDPYKIRTSFSREEIELFLSTMDEIGFIRYSRVYDKGFGTLIYTLWKPKITPAVRKAAVVFNKLLMRLWFPVLVLGALLFWLRRDSISLSGGVVAGTIFGFLLGIPLHELAHGLAGVAYGAYFYEAGVLVYHFMPGAYTMIEDTHIKNKRKRVQILAAGVEMNFLLAGISLMLAALIGWFGEFFLLQAINNLFMGVINLLLIKGLDGYQIMAVLLGGQSDDLSRLSWRLRMSKQNPNRRAATMAQVVIGAFQLMLPVLYLMNIVMVIEWIR